MAHASPLPDHLLREVQLASSAEENDMYDGLAEVFAILRTLEFLELAYIRDTIKPDDYCRECDRLLSQYKLASNRLGDTFNLEQFEKDYDLRCPSAKSRIKAGVNQVTLDGDGSRTNNKARDAAECTSALISLSDALELDAKTKEELHPELIKILRYLQRFSDLPSDFAGIQTMQKWISTLSPMSATDELNDTQLSDVRFDVASVVDEFKAAL